MLSNSGLSDLLHTAPAASRPPSPPHPSPSPSGYTQVQRIHSDGLTGDAVMLSNSGLSDLLHTAPAASRTPPPPPPPPLPPPSGYTQVQRIHSGGLTGDRDMLSDSGPSDTPHTAPASPPPPTPPLPIPIWLHTGTADS